MNLDPAAGVLGARFSLVLVRVGETKRWGQKKVIWGVSSRGVMGIPALPVSLLQHPLCHEVLGFPHGWPPDPLQALGKPTDRTMA